MATRAIERQPHAIGGVDTRPLRQQIADALQRAILDGELVPGAPLVEMDIAHQLGVSRAPVREALQLLARANLVDAPTDGHRFDIIFCRHVLADADPARRGEMFDNLERRLVDDGCLFLGPDEQPDGDSIAFRPVAGRKGLFVKSPAALRRAA